RPRDAARQPHPHDGPVGRLVGLARGRGALPLAARGLRAHHGPPRGISARDDIHRVFAAFRGGDVRALVEVIAEDAVWRVAGTVPVAREYRGREEIFDLFRSTRRLTDGTYRSELRSEE